MLFWNSLRTNPGSNVTCLLHTVPTQNGTNSPKTTFGLDE